MHWRDGTFSDVADNYIDFQVFLVQADFLHKAGHKTKINSTVPRRPADSFQKGTILQS